MTSSATPSPTHSPKGSPPPSPKDTPRHTSIADGLTGRVSELEMKKTPYTPAKGVEDAAARVGAAGLQATEKMEVQDNKGARHDDLSASAGLGKRQLELMQADDEETDPLMGGGKGGDTLLDSPRRAKNCCERLRD